MTEFVTALKQEIKLLATRYQPRLRTVFIGGGTPTVLSQSDLEAIITTCQQEFTWGADVEFTIEANPGTVDQEKLELLQELGVNRLSFGVQSCNDYWLEQLGRVHTLQQAIDNYYQAREVGFTNINLDLIFALPGQSIDDWELTLDLACQLDPDHLSTYNLQFEEGTLFYKWLQEGKLTAVSQDLDLEMYQLAQKKLNQAGYQQYEISNFANNNKKCQHNYDIWLNQSYLALGPGAHFYDGIARGYNYQSIKKYCQSISDHQLPVANYCQLSLEEEIEETMMLGLRLTAGISRTEFIARYNCSVFDIYQEELHKLEANGLLEIKQDRIALTPQGRLLANQVVAEFLLT
ncbi:radical SAM family heme chaperone HemW [Halanaerobaculum tunisiense]